MTTALGTTVLAHEMMLKGTVAATEPTRIQIKTGEEKKGQVPGWVLIDAKTKILRDKTEVTLTEAKIKVGERVVAEVNHDADGVMKALEIRLAAHPN
jgi:hypothetical protein